MRKHDQHGEYWIIASILLEEPLNFSEIKAELSNSVKKFGFYGFLSRQKDAEFSNWLKSSLDGMEKDGWLTAEDSKYRLTELGREEGRLAKEESLFSLN